MLRALRDLLAQNRRLGDVEASLRTIGQLLEQHGRDLEQLRGDLDWLAGEIKRLRGHVTGGSRKPKEEPAPNGPPPVDVNELIKQGRYIRRKP